MVQKSRNRSIPVGNKKVLKSSYFDFVDLIVLGVHSQSIVKNIFVGSLTKQLITEAKKALFIGI